MIPSEAASDVTVRINGWILSVSISVRVGVRVLVIGRFGDMVVLKWWLGSRFITYEEGDQCDED